MIRGRLIRNVPLPESRVEKENRLLACYPGFGGAFRTLDRRK